MKFTVVFRRFLQFDWVLFSAVLLLSGMSILVLYGFSAEGKPEYFLRQSIFVGIGFLVSLFLASLDYRHIGRHSTLLYFSMLGILLSVLLFGKTIRGTEGWIDLGFTQVQPVEFAKVVLVLFLASFIAKKTSELGEWTRLIASLILTGMLVFLVMRQPDLGSSIVLLGVWGMMLLISGIRLKHIVVLSILGSLLVSGSWFFLADYQRARIESFMHPELDPKGSGYNVLQAMVAVGSGGVFGKGIGHGTQSQSNFLPEKHTDFIFASINEELGMAGAFLTLFLYGVIFYRLRTIGIQASDNFGYLITVGVYAIVLVQVSINIGMNVGLLPVTGIPLPFMSYGGSSVLSLFIGIGIVQNVYRLRRGEQYTVSQNRSEGDYIPLDYHL
ncbi:MAG: rod shape-determining protein RodA [Candidatus Moraniibacteriota bacterium]